MDRLDRQFVEWENQLRDNRVSIDTILSILRDILLVSLVLLARVYDGLVLRQGNPERQLSCSYLLTSHKQVEPCILDADVVHKTVWSEQYHTFN